MFYIEESKDSYLMTSCKSALKTITIDDISYCNRLAIEITGNIEDGENLPSIRILLK